MSQPEKLIVPCRDFLKSGSVLTAAGALAGVSASARFVHAAESNEIKVALVGCGGRGTGALGDMMKTSHPVKLVAMADMFEDNLHDALRGFNKASFANKVDVPKDRQFVGFDAYQKAIDAGVDLVILATPPGFRPMHFEAAVNAGKHIFMEKPVATDAGRRSQGARRRRRCETRRTSVSASGCSAAIKNPTSKRSSVCKTARSATFSPRASTGTARRRGINNAKTWKNKKKAQLTEMEYQLAQLVLLHLDLRRSYRRAAHPQHGRDQLAQEGLSGQGQRHGRLRGPQRQGLRRNVRPPLRRVRICRRHARCSASAAIFPSA